MDLILWRHAEAEEGGPALPDGKRRLTPRGEKQARDMARWLARRLPKKLRILVSPAARTLQTVHPLGLPFEIEENVGTGGTADDLLAAIDWERAGGTVLVVGHQPTLGEVAARLMTGEDAGWAVKKGGIWWFSSRVRNDETRTVLRAVINPDMISV